MSRCIQCYCQCNEFQLIVKLALRDGMESREKRLKGTGTHTERLIWQLLGVKFFHSSASIVHLPFSSSSTHDNNITWRPGRPANVVQLENVKIAQTENREKSFESQPFIMNASLLSLSAKASTIHYQLNVQTNEQIMSNKCLTFTASGISILKKRKTREFFPLMSRP